MAEMHMTELHGQQLVLRLLTESDLPDLLRVYQATPDYFGLAGPTSADVWQQWHLAQITPGRQLFGIYHRDVRQYIGAADVQIGVPQPETAALWILIESRWQHQGYAQECIAILEQWLISVQGVESLCAIASRTETSLRFLELQGFRETDTPAVAPVGSEPAFWMCW